MPVLTAKRRTACAATPSSYWAQAAAGLTSDSRASASAPIALLRRSTPERKATGPRGPPCKGVLPEVLGACLQPSKHGRGGGAVRTGRWLATAEGSAKAHVRSGSGCTALQKAAACTQYHINITAQHPVWSAGAGSWCSTCSAVGCAAPHPLGNVSASGPAPPLAAGSPAASLLLLGSQARSSSSSRPRSPCVAGRDRGRRGWGLGFGVEGPGRAAGSGRMTQGVLQAARCPSHVTDYKGRGAPRRQGCMPRAGPHAAARTTGPWAPPPHSARRPPHPAHYPRSQP